jgi:hypothetical protein
MYSSLAFNSCLKELMMDDECIPKEFYGKSLDEVRKFFDDLKSEKRETSLDLLKKWKGAPLLWSCQIGDEKCVKRFLEVGANPSATDEVYKLKFN